jgi:hypothetical protein
MNKLSIGLCLGLSLTLSACDIKNDYNKPKTQVRSMVIGGMPVHDQDYKIPQIGVLETQAHTRPSNRVK